MRFRWHMLAGGAVVQAALSFTLAYWHSARGGWGVDLLWGVLGLLGAAAILAVGYTEARLGVDLWP